MLNNKQLEDLLYSFSSFYREFLPVDNSLMKLVNIYAQTIDYVWTVFGEADDSTFVSTARTVSTVPYFKVNVDDALYDANTARALSRMTFDEQIAYLDKENKYASFVFNFKDNAGDPVVYSMRLFVNFTDKSPLKLYEDYFIRSNRLYLLPKYMQNKKKTVHYLHAFDIKINDYTLEKNFGTRFSLQSGPLLPRYEYRDVLEAFIRAFQGQMTIKSIRDSIQLATKWENFKIEDYKSPNISPRKLEIYKQWIISPFKFIVSLPESLIPDKIKINIVRTLLNEVKEVHTDYMVFFDIERNDPYTPPMDVYPTIHYQREEDLTSTDEHNVKMVNMTFVDNPMDFGDYDSKYFYDENLQYDTGMKESTLVTHRTLKIPRSFSASTNNATNEILFSADTMQIENVQLELHAAKDSSSPFELVEIVWNNPSGAKNSFFYNAYGSGYQVYKSRSKQGDIYSCFTLPTTVTYDVIVAFFENTEIIDDQTLTLDEAHAFDDSQGTEQLLNYLLDLTIYQIDF